MSDDRGWEWAESLCPGCSTAWDLHWYNQKMDPPIVALIETDGLPLTENVVWAIRPLDDGQAESWFYRGATGHWRRGPTIKYGVTSRVTVSEPEDEFHVEVKLGVKKP